MVIRWHLLYGCAIYSRWWWWFIRVFTVDYVYSLCIIKSVIKCWRDGCWCNGATTRPDRRAEDTRNWSTSWRISTGGGDGERCRRLARVCRTRRRAPTPQQRRLFPPASSLHSRRSTPRNGAWRGRAAVLRRRTYRLPAGACTCCAGSETRSSPGSRWAAGGPPTNTGRRWTGSGWRRTSSPVRAPDADWTPSATSSSGRRRRSHRSKLGRRWTPPVWSRRLATGRRYLHAKEQRHLSSLMSNWNKKHSESANLHQSRFYVYPYNLQPEAGADSRACRLNSLLVTRLSGVWPKMIKIPLKIHGPGSSSVVF